MNNSKLINRVLLRGRGPPSLRQVSYKFFIFAHYVYIYSNQIKIRNHDTSRTRGDSSSSKN